MQDQNTPYKCECGETFTGKFCPNCGAMRKEEKTFTCDCGYTGLAKNFCPECGKKITDNVVIGVPVQQPPVGYMANGTPAVTPTEPEEKLGWKCHKCGAENQEEKCTVCGAEIRPEILFGLSTYQSSNPPVTTSAAVFEYSDTELLFDNNGKRSLISIDVIEPAMEIIRKHRLNDPDFKDKAAAGIMGGDVFVGFKDGDKYVSTSLHEQGFAVQNAEYELKKLFCNA